MLFVLNWVCNENRAWAIIKSFDRTGNAAFNGRDDELISTRAGRGKREGRYGWCLLCWLLNKIDELHCEKSVG
jgi:hypothetical protein